MQGGWRPNSILIGDEWIDYSTWAPLALPMMAVANFAEAAKDLKGREATLTEMAGQLVLRTADSILNQGILQGLRNLHEALSSREPIPVNRLIAGHVQQFVPFSGAMRTATQLKDPIIRTPEGLTESVKSITPGLSKQVQPLLDPFGRPTRRVGSALTSGLVSRSPVVNDPVTEMLLALDIPLARPLKRLEDADGAAIPLSPEEETALGMARGFTKRANLEKARKRAEGRPVERQIELLERAKASDIPSITRRARRMKERGEALEPRRLVSKRLVDRLYQEYLDSRR